MQKNAKYLGIIEFQDDNNEWIDFIVMELNDRLLFGSACNVGFLECGYIMREDGESLEKTLNELHEDLQAYYNDNSSNRIVYNERM
jgi:hypothetical protein